MVTVTRAWSTLDLKSVEEDSRIIRGIASTPVTDRAGDIVEPKGAKFALPLPLLWQHNPERPLGHVTAAKATEGGIEVVAEILKGVLPYIDDAWALIKAGAVRGFSIGFRALEAEDIKDSKTWGRRFKQWEWLELSAVTIAANQDASITSIKALDLQHLRALPGNAPLPVVRLGYISPAAVGRHPYVIRKIHV
jgi:HK97 family phage prohead protease